jgi:hypothetical protein
MLLMLIPDDRRHKNCKFWFDPTFPKRVYYGESTEKLIYAEGLDIIGKLPPIHLTDLQAAFELGLQAGRQEKKS